MEEGSAQNGYEGTGFVVGAGAKWNELRTYKIDGTDYKAPLIATNLHVVKDASEITAEFYGLHKEPLQLKKVLTAPDYDLALLEVKKSEIPRMTKLLQTLGKTADDFYIPTFGTAGEAALGECCCSFGFPVGEEVETAGEITGSAEVGTGGVVLSTSAAVSEGSSGGPLTTCTDKGPINVVGINFQTVGGVPGAENNNYLVQAFKLQIVIDRYNKSPDTYNTKNCGNDLPSCEFQVPPVDSQTITSTPALKTLVGCPDQEGHLVTKINSRSVLKTADPPLPEGHFLLTSVRGVQLDKRGEGEYADCFGT